VTSTDAMDASHAPRVFYSSIRGFIRDLPGSAKRFWLLVLATGIAAGLGAALLVKLLTLVQHLAWPPGSSFFEQVSAARPIDRIRLPVVGGVVVMLLAGLFRGPLGGHGTAEVIESIWIRAGRISLVRSLVRGVSSIVVVALGAPLGREGALIQTGAATGSWLGERLRIPVDQVRVLVACGASAGIAAAYNVPIGAALFGLEALLGSFALELFGPIVVCCGVATLISRALVAGHPSYVIPHYALLTPREVLFGTMFAPLFGAAAALYIWVIDGLPILFERVPRRLALIMIPASLAAVGAVSVHFPELLGNGYDTVDAALLNHLPLLLLLLLPMFKMLATGVCAGAGVPGGLFTPSLYYGALLGGAVGQLVNLVWPGVGSPGAYALIGMGAVLAGTTHAAISSVLIIFELTGDYDVILPLMLTCAISATVSRRLEPRSLYTAVLARRGIHLPEVPRPEWLRARRVDELLHAEHNRTAAKTHFEQVVVQLLALPPGHDLYVTSDDGRYLGVIVLDALKGHLPESSLLRMIVAADVMDSSVEPVTLGSSLSEAQTRLSETWLDKLPVIDTSGRLVGTVSKGDLLRGRRY
jgi:CIC family chloride channel protein